MAKAVAIGAPGGELKHLYMRETMLEEGRGEGGRKALEEEEELTDMTVGKE